MYQQQLACPRCHVRCWNENMHVSAHKKKPSVLFVTVIRRMKRLCGEVIRHNCWVQRSGRIRTADDGAEGDGSLSSAPFPSFCAQFAPLSCLLRCHHPLRACDLPNLSVARPPYVAVRSPHHLFLSPQLIASNMEGKSSPSEVLVCTTNPDKPGPPSTPCVAAATPYGFTVTWGKDGQRSHKHR